MLNIEKFLYGSFFVILFICVFVIKNQMNTIEDLEYKLKNKDNEIIREIEVCNNDKEVAAYKAQYEEYKELFDANVRAANKAIEKQKELQLELSDLEDVIMVYQEKDIKCLNDFVDSGYLQKIKEIINDKK